MTPEEFAALAARHGGQAGAMAVDPYTKDETGEPEKNYTPRYRITFRDGTYIEVKPQARWQDDAGEPEILGWDVTDWGTAEGPKSEQPKAPTTRQGPDGKEYQWNAQTGQWEPAPGIPSAPAKPNVAPASAVDPTDEYYLVWDATQGQYVRQPNPNYDPRMAALKREATEADLAYKKASLANLGASTAETGRHNRWSEWWQPEETRLKLDYDREQDKIKNALDREKQDFDKSKWAQQYENSRDTLTSNTADWWTGRQIQATPLVVDPSWTSYPGFEAGGPMEQLYRMGGSTGYTPPAIPRVNIDFDAAWRVAQGKTRG